VERGNAGKVEDVNVVPDGHLCIIKIVAIMIFIAFYLNVDESIHLLDSSSAAHGQTVVQAMSSIQKWDEEGLGGDQAEAVLVQLDTKFLHGLHGLVAEGHLHVDDVAPE
jgi:hypothetical protein